MRARNNPEGPIPLVAIVEVNPHGKHRLEHGDGWLSVQHAGFDRPRTEAFCLDFLSNSDRGVLMKGHFPVGTGDFVEEHSAYWKAILTEYGFDEISDPRGFCESPDFRRSL